MYLLWASVQTFTQTFHPFRCFNTDKHAYVHFHRINTNRATARELEWHRKSIGNWVFLEITAKLILFEPQMRTNWNKEDPCRSWRILMLRWPKFRTLFDSDIRITSMNDMFHSTEHTNIWSRMLINPHWNADKNMKKYWHQKAVISGYKSTRSQRSYIFYRNNVFISKCNMVFSNFDLTQLHYTY